MLVVSPENPVTPAVRLLATSGFLQIACASLLGMWMLVRMQPWGAARGGRAGLKDLGAAHVDLILLGLLEIAAAWALQAFVIADASWIAVLLVLGGWLNPVPYVARAHGINAFVLGGGRTQRAFALLGLASSLALTAGIGGLVVAMIA